MKHFSIILDSLVGSRSSGDKRSVQEKVLSTLLNEMDGVGIRRFQSKQTKITEGGNSEQTNVR